MQEEKAPALGSAGGGGHDNPPGGSDPVLPTLRSAPPSPLRSVRRLRPSPPPSPPRTLAAQRYHRAPHNPLATPPESAKAEFYKPRQLGGGARMGEFDRPWSPVSFSSSPGTL